MPSLRRVLRLTTTLAMLGLAVLAGCQSRQSGESYDVIIRNGHIIDGTGSPWYSGDVGVRDGRIAAIGDLSGDSANQVIDAKGKVVAPGFIDMLGQSELTLLVDPRAPSKIYQGITTEITGEGESVAPLDSQMVAANMPGYKHYGITPDWRTLPQYFARLEKQGIGINMGTYVGATTARELVLGYDDVQPTAAQVGKMQNIVSRAMRDGAFGVSTALQYPPAPYARTAELVALARVASQYGGIYATHMRSEGNAEMAALDEVFHIAREANVPVEIFHLKTAGTSNWGKMPQVVARIDSARKAGLDITSDTYAYTAWENGMAAFIPPWAHDGGTDSLVARLQDPATRAKIKKDMLTPTSSWDNEWQEIPGPHAVLVTAVNNPDLRAIQGKRLDEIAKDMNEDPIDALFDVLVKDRAGTYVAVFGMSEPDVELALKQPWVSIDNDASASSPEGILGEEHPHPRAYGTFPRILRKFVREQHLLTLPDAIRKFAALPAQRMGLTDRGVIKKGMWADLVVFDPATVTDKATFEDPAQFSVGMQYVLVNGVPVIADGEMTGKLPGQVLKGPGYGR
ncbi:MAG TPA: D-aminoacylase [Longimicrobiales bacterium]|nr:D-aminoacylase [Longimicrobiales bacterium]